MSKVKREKVTIKTKEGAWYLLVDGAEIKLHYPLTTAPGLIKRSLESCNYFTVEIAPADLAGHIARNRAAFEANRNA